MKARRTGVLTHVTDARTAAVVVTRLVRHPKYGKTYRRSRTFLVDTLTTVDLGAGTVVTIEATRPISKRKHWQIVAIDDQGKRQKAKGKMSEGSASEKADA